MHRFRNTLLTLDAIGLGVFCATGTVKALDFGIEPLGAAVLGAIRWDWQAPRPRPI